jgi:exonuclease SbcD
MKIGIFSDTHLGFGSDERYDEAFSRVDEAIEKFHELKVDYILHAGDLFDHAVPTQEVWHKSFECFNKNKGELKELVKNNFKRESSIAKARGIPIIAIHGTHEFRGADFSNALDILEEGNALCHIHIGDVELEKNGEKVVIHGMSGVPEKHAFSLLKKYDPKPRNDATNIILFHQSFKEFLPFDDDAIASLSLNDLPEGFDLIINGHLHWRDEQKLDNRRFLLTGSTIFTQMKRLEAKREKGIFVFDTISKDLEFFPFEKQRKLFYEKIKFKDEHPVKIKEMVEEKISEFLKNDFEIKPLIRFKLTGTIAKGFSVKDVKFDLPEEKAIFSITKNFQIQNFKSQINALKEIQNEKKGVIDMGIEILEKNLEEAKIDDFDTRRIFELLLENKNEEVEKLLLK